MRIINDRFKTRIIDDRFKRDLKKTRHISVPGLNSRN